MPNNVGQMLPSGKDGTNLLSLMKRQPQSKRQGTLILGTSLLLFSQLIADDDAKPFTYPPLTKAPEYNWENGPTALPSGFVFPDPSPVPPEDLDSLKISQSKVTSSEDAGKKTAETQKKFDLFSWATFMALNWPANENGSPSVKHNILKEKEAKLSPRVWESYMSPSQFFREGHQPEPWGTPERERRSLRANSKRTHILDEVDEAFFNLSTPMPSITDLNNEYVRYEVRFNKVAYKSMQSLYSIEKQASQIAKYLGQHKDETNIIDLFNFPEGAMELKVAWKKMGKDDTPSKFYTIEATVKDPSTHATSHGTYGMVGMHIMVRTASAPQWVWATFEHIDNSPRSFLPLKEGGIKPESGKKYSFWNKEGKHSYAGFDEDVYDTLTLLEGATKGNYYQEKESRKPSQITQAITSNNDVITSKWTTHLNEVMRKKLQGTVWENYRLVSTQWPTDPGQKPSSAYPNPPGNPAPVSLGNPVMETYLQVNGSCMACHAGATVSNEVMKELKNRHNIDFKGKVYTNFSFMLQRAKSESSPKSK